ncbi:MAG: tRNA-dependent cyclodipeptide synthase [Alphaproteobacteria bacterium]|nr:tRNA-dependent cyclodipeptide synthase [Alphaproteobacteria bacterium]
MIFNDRYKVIVRHSPGWRGKEAATLGVSVGSPNWQDDKFVAILDFAARNFKTIRIDVTDALYRYNFMAKGLSAHNALTQANALGALWLAKHQATIDAAPVRPRIVRWAEWYAHPDFQETLDAFKDSYKHDEIFRTAVEKDIDHFYGRKNNCGQQAGWEYSKDYLIEEVAVSTLQARELASVKIYPGDDLECLRVVRQRLVKDAPCGLEHEQFAKVKFYTRPAHKKNFALFQKCSEEAPFQRTAS